MKRVAIVGAGLSGLIAAHAWPGANVFERATVPTQNHKALLRFRGESIAALTGIEFRRVTVRKALWSENRFHRSATLRDANSYSAKVLGQIANDRSVWSLEPVERWIAPENFYEMLVENVGKRIQWGIDFDYAGAVELDNSHVVSTIPLPLLLPHLSLRPHESMRFESSPITTRRYRVADCDVFQTVYFPELGLPIYRASITGDLLIIESVGEPLSLVDEAAIAEHVFGIEGRTMPIDSAAQRFGKIAEIPAAARGAFLFTLTNQYGIYSLGRFATWRNVLLDDLVHDIAVIKKLIAGDAYGARITAATTDD